MLCKTVKRKGKFLKEDSEGSYWELGGKKYYCRWESKFIKDLEAMEIKPYKASQEK